MMPVSTFECVQAADAEWRAAAGFFGLSVPSRSGVMRRKDFEKKLFCVSDGAAHFLLARASTRIRVVCAVVRLLESMHEVQEGRESSAWRVKQEGVSMLLTECGLQ